MVRLSQFAKIFHSLRFQLPAVVLGVFLGIMFLLFLLNREMNKINNKTSQLAESAEVTNLLAQLANRLDASAADRVSYESLGDEKDLANFKINLDRITGLYAEIKTINHDYAAGSTDALGKLYDKHLEYQELFVGFAQEQAARRQAMRMKAEAPVSMQKPVPAPSKKGSKSKALRKTATKPGKGKSLASHQAPAKQIESPESTLDKQTNEKFRAYEKAQKAGLVQTQHQMEYERSEKLKSLRISVVKAKTRLWYSLALLLAMAGYVAVILKWKILDPMNFLKAGVVEIGKGHLGFQVSINARNEIGELADVFNRMSVQLDQKRNAEVRLKRLEAIEQIVRSVNHEINNPLMIISGNAEYLLAILESSNEDTKSKLNSIVSEVRRIFLVTQRLKEIKEPLTENYIGTSDQMIDLARSSQIRERDY